MIEPPVEALVVTFGFALVPVLCGYAVRAWYSWTFHARRFAHDRSRRRPTSPLYPRLREPRHRWRWLFPAHVILGGLFGLAFGAWLSPWIVELAPRALSTLLPPLIAQKALLEPLAEELGKGLPLFLVYRTRWIEDSLDGVWYGVGAGLGFAAVENLLYFTSALALGGPEQWWSSIESRIVFSTLVHGVATGALGAYLGAARRDGGALVQWLAPIAGLAAGLFVHGLWNGLIIEAQAAQSVPLAIAAVSLVAAASAALLAVFRVAIRPPAGV